MVKFRQSVEPTFWRGHGGRARILVEHHDPGVGVATANLLAAEGYEVATCTGPASRFPCALVDEGQCSRVAQADVVVFGLEVEDELDREVLNALKAQSPTTAIVVEIPPGRVPFYQEELAGCVAIPRPMTRDALLDAVGRALA